MEAINILGYLIALATAGYSFYQFRKIQKIQSDLAEAKSKPSVLTEEEKKELLDSESKKKLNEAEQKAQNLIKEAERQALTYKREAAELEKSILERDKILTRKSETLLDKESKLDQEGAKLDTERENVKKERLSISDKLAEVAGLSKEEAKSKLLQDAKVFIEKDYAKLIREHRERIEKESEQITREILVDAMTSSATDFTAEYTTTHIPVDGEATKGKIIGKEGRNIKAFEKLTGVELIMDEADDYVVLSCFDPLRRELAKIVLLKLLKDGRIHPARIEEFVQKARLDLAKQIIKDGEEIAYKAGFPNLSLEHLRFLGRMKYRFSYGQCLAQHVLEVVNIAGHIAQELGLNVQLAKECALWHDIGKVITHEKEGDHMELGEEIGRKLKLKEEVINAMYAHHMAKDPVCMESAIIYIADANSGARPGARYGKDEDYVKRIKALEDIAKNHYGVKESYAVDAGREVRVFVDPVSSNDDHIIVLSQEIAKEIQESLVYPGTVKVTVIREIRATAMAK